MLYWWTDPAVEELLGIALVDVMYMLLGIYGLEYFQSLGVEYAIICGRLRFRWPLVPYVLGRFLLLVALILLAFELSPMSAGWGCQAGIISISVIVDIVTGITSTNFAIRTWMMWESHLVRCLLVALALGQWTLLTVDITNIRASKVNGACVLRVLHPDLSAAVLMFTVCYDLIVLVLSIVKLSQQPLKSPLKERLRAQSLMYFVIATISNIPPVVFGFLGSDTMVAITGNVALTASTIVSCRAVRSLFDLRGESCSSSHTLEGSGDAGMFTTQAPSSLGVLPRTSEDSSQDEQTV